MSITATELKNNLSYYLALASKESIYITKNGRDIAVLTSPFSFKMQAMLSLRGIIPDDGMTAKDYREERISKYL
ncbi:MAG: type II toxin-antitoxin system Phd/YefM family antitoxin [Spirochaetales bacterium]|nr:type II toxin-antitoxin system Phd/YefM family antitoxin [Spirochaetales bacterium]